MSCSINSLYHYRKKTMFNISSPQNLFFNIVTVLDYFEFCDWQFIYGHKQLIMYTFFYMCNMAWRDYDLKQNMFTQYVFASIYQYVVFSIVYLSQFFNYDFYIWDQFNRNPIIFNTNIFIVGKWTFMQIYNTRSNCLLPLMNVSRRFR